MKRVLVTGATGCIGRHILPGLLATGWEVHGVSSRDREQAAGPVRWHRAELLDASQTESLVATVRPSHLLHLAWYIAPGKWAMAPDNLRWVRASLNLLQSFQAHGGTRVVTAGSCLEYDWHYGYCAEERTPCQPHTIYGTCKHALQLLTTAHAASTGMSSAWARIFFLYGPYEHPARLVASVIRSVLDGEPAKCSHGLQIRDYLFVQDVADAMVALLESDVSGPINIASGQAITLRDIVTRAGTLLGRPELIQLGAIPAAATDTPLVVADTAQAVRLLPSWRPKVSLDEGLQRTIDWWRQRHVTFEAHLS
jgi:nucleoside-diphosphate-sugar epimerase